VMPDSVAIALLLLTTAYVGIGASFACLFVSRGVPTVDPAASKAPRSFRLIIFPGVLALWPWIVLVWITAHRCAARSASPAHESAEVGR